MLQKVKKKDKPFIDFPTILKAYKYLKFKNCKPKAVSAFNTHNSEWYHET